MNARDRDGKLPNGYAMVAEHSMGELTEELPAEQLCTVEPLYVRHPDDVGHPGVSQQAQVPQDRDGHRECR